MDIVRWREIPELQQHPGHHRRQVEFDTCFLALHRYSPGGEGYDMHSHPETQVGCILEGEMAMIFPSGPATLSNGQFYVIPTSVRHGGKGTGSTDALVINLYVKRHLVGPTDESVRVGRWTDAGARSVVGCGVTQTLLEVHAHGVVPAALGGVHDHVDIVLAGSATLTTDADRPTLETWDAVRGTPRTSQIQAGPKGCVVLRLGFQRLFSPPVV